MAFTVTRPAGNVGTDSVAYARALARQGQDIGRVARVPDPGNAVRRWVPAWDSREAAERFAECLREESGDDGWRVEASDAEPSEGPLGPVVLQLIQRSDGLVFLLHPLSGNMIRSAFPDATPALTNAFVSEEAWVRFSQKHGGLVKLVDQVAPVLTGLDPAQLAGLGYAIVDAEDDRTWHYQPPRDAAPGHAPPGGVAAVAVAVV
jgi:hypothetical protein